MEDRDLEIAACAAYEFSRQSNQKSATPFNLPLWGDLAQGDRDLMIECQRAAWSAVEKAAEKAGPPDPGSDNPNCVHEWAYTGTAYGGDDDRWCGEGRCYCVKCGADGDA